MKAVRFNGFLRILAKVFPLKQRLNFLIDDYLRSKHALAISYYKFFKIKITPNETNQGTLSDLIFEGARYLPEYSLIQKIKNDLPSNFTYVDAGSNIGTTVWLFANEAKLVYAFEPIPHLNNVIQESMTLNRSTNIVLKDKALGDKQGEIFMHNNNNSSVAVNVSDDTLKISVSTLDIELQQAQEVHFIKIDVEGFELNVLQGAVQTLQKFNPFLLVELHPGFIKNYNSDCRYVIEFLEERGYEISYYSFLYNLRMARVNRFLNRWMGAAGKKFRNKQEFFDDLTKEPELSSYHLYCKPGRA